MCRLLILIRRVRNEKISVTILVRQVLLWHWSVFGVWWRQNFFFVPFTVLRSTASWRAPQKDECNKKCTLCISWLIDWTYSFSYATTNWCFYCRLRLRAGWNSWTMQWIQKRLLLTITFFIFRKKVDTLNHVLRLSALVSCDIKIPHLLLSNIYHGDRGHGQLIHFMVLLE